MYDMTAKQLFDEFIDVFGRSYRWVCDVALDLRHWPEAVSKGTSARCRSVYSRGKVFGVFVTHSYHAKTQLMSFSGVYYFIMALLFPVNAVLLLKPFHLSCAGCLCHVLVACVMCWLLVLCAGCLCHVLVACVMCWLPVS